MRIFVNPRPPGWRFHRFEGGNQIFRLERDLGATQLHIGGGLVFVCERKGVKEWDGVVFRAWVEVTRVGVGGLAAMGSSVQWYA